VTGRLAFPLISRRRLVGSPFGARRSARRGRGGETAGTRPYLPWDPVSTIEWVASARLSAARGTDEFIVREQYSEEAPVVAIVLDRRPSMGLYAPPSPWLDKQAAVRIAVRAIVESADEARAVVGALDERHTDAWGIAPVRGRVGLVLARTERAAYDAPANALDEAVQRLLRHRRALPPGSFVFIVSDFLGTVSATTRGALRGLGADLVPVIVQDPTWERSFPDVPGVLLPTVDAESGEPRPVRLTRGETRARAAAHEQRYDALIARLRTAGMDSVTLESAEPERIHAAFLAWAARRRRLLRRAR
jgi:uncharacterized protein (DUF58 family)